MPYPANLRATIQQCCKDFNSAINDPNCSKCIVDPSVPILWFGDLEEYMVSPTKIVTVGINPSNHEFPNGQLGARFKGITSWTGKSCLSSSDIDTYCAALNSYFSYNPYKSWFAWNESALLGLDASYYKGMPNHAVHIDFEAPIATDPVWSGLNITERDTIAKYFNKYFDQMMQILSPDIVIIGINVSSFRKAFSSCAGNGINLLPHKPKGGYIRVYQTYLNGKSCKVVWNRVKSAPFAFCGTQNDITNIFLSNSARFFQTMTSHSPSSYIDNLKGMLSNYDSIMLKVVQNTDLTFESRGYREHYVNIEDLQNRELSLKEKLEDIRKLRWGISDQEERDRLEQEMVDLKECLQNIRILIGNGGREEEPLLGQYDPVNKTITLFMDNIEDEASTHGYNLDHLTGYVFIHEMFHAYYDVDCQFIREIEEAMAEYGALSFINSINQPDTFDIAMREIQGKQYSCTWTSAYGFGKYIFDHDPYSNLANDYRKAKASIHGKGQLTSAFSDGFRCGYPFDIESMYLNLLYRIIHNIPYYLIMNSYTTIDFDLLMNAIKKVISNHSQNIHSVNDIKKMFPKHLMSKYGSGQIIYDPQDTIKYLTCKASVNGIDYEIHKDGQGWRDHKLQIIEHICQNPDNLFTKDDQIELLAAITISGI